MSSKIKSKTNQFFREFGVKEISLTILTDIIKKQGYTIIEYDSTCNDEDVENLIHSLKLEQQIKHSKGFTYADANCRLVFLNEGLSEKEKTYVLSHEEGHIYCGHLSAVPIIGNDVVEEHEANEFAHYILNQSFSQRFAKYVATHKKAIIAVLLALLIVVTGIIAIQINRNERSYYGDYYITETGNKYHRKDCIFVKDKTNTHRMTKEEFDTGEYEPCKMCLPNNTDAD